MKLFKNIQPDFIDERGAIAKILDDGKTNIKSILLITSAKGTIRANHYHKKDSHYCYLVSGKIEYTEQPVDKSSTLETAILESGDMIFSPPMVMHAFRFLEDTVFWAFATESRRQTDYESDTVRVNLIS